MIFHKACHDCGLELVKSFVNLLYSNISRREECDKMRWRLRGHGGCTIFSYYDAIQGSTTNSLHLEEHLVCQGPKRVSFFLWTATQGKIITCDHFIKQGLSLVG